MPRRISVPSLRGLLVIFGLVGLPVIGVDQVTKALAAHYLADGEARPLIGNLISLQLVRNPGAAFSFGSGSTWVFILVAAGVIAAVAYLAPTVTSGRWRAALGTLLGGAVGNLIDRLVQPPGFGHGHVVDFINYHGWFIGNIADVAIVVGVIAVVILTLLSVPMGVPARGADAH